MRSEGSICQNVQRNTESDWYQTEHVKGEMDDLYDRRDEMYCQHRNEGARKVGRRQHLKHLPNPAILSHPRFCVWHGSNRAQE